MSKESDVDFSSFRDILEDRRHSSDFMWLSREVCLTKSYKQNHDTSNPYKFQYNVFQSPRIQQLITEVSKEKNVPVKRVRQTVLELLQEIGHTRHLPVFRCVGLAFMKVLKKIVSGVHVNEERLLEIKRNMGTNPVVFIPSHRSYFDFLLMGYITFSYDIETPCIAAGMDFMSMWLVGKLLRGCNAFFMRRSFGGDRLYRTVFQEYVQRLVVAGDTPLEFFIEGTRSRSAKALTPKFGLLTMLLEPFFTGEVPDITLVPVSISYSRVLEEKLFAYELLGIPKPKESTSGLIKALNLLDEKYGDVHAVFGEPVSLRSYVTQTLSSPLNFVHRNLPREAAQINNLGYHIVDCQQKNMVLNSFHLLSITLSNHLMVDAPDGKYLSLEQASKDVAWLAAVLSTLGALVQPIPHSEALAIVAEAVEVHKSLVELSPSGTIHLVPANLDGANLDNCRWKGHALSSDIMNVAIPLFMLQQYVNPCLHFLVSPAIITIVMQHLGEGETITKQELYKKYSFICSLMAHEFVFFKPWEEKVFEDALSKLELVSIVEGELLRLGNHRKLQTLLCNLLYPFFSGYLSVCRLLRSLETSDVVTEAQLLKMVQAKMEEELSCGWLSHPYSLSLDLISSCFSSLTSVEVLLRTRVNGVVQYKVQEHELLPVLGQLESLVVGPLKYLLDKDQDLADNSKTICPLPTPEPMHGMVSKL